MLQERGTRSGGFLIIFALFFLIFWSPGQGSAQGDPVVEDLGRIYAGPKTLWSPGVLSVAGDGTIFVVDSYLNHVVGFDAEGKLLGDFKVPLVSAVAVSSDDTVYIGSHKDMSVAVYRAGQRVGYLGKGAGEFSSIRDLAVDPVNGYVYAVDNVGNQLKVYDPSGRFVRSFGGLTLPRAAAVTETNVYVIDGPLTADGSSTRSRVTVLDKSLRVVNVIDERFGEGCMTGASDIAVSGAYIFITDAGLNSVLVYEQGVGCLGEIKALSDDLRLPVSLAFSAGKLYVSSSVTNSIHVFAVASPAGSGAGR